MSKFIEFKTTDDGTHLLVEVDDKEVTTGIAKAGLREVAGRTISQAQEIFEQAIQTALQINVETFYKAIQALPHPPTDVEISFGLKATGELGNFAISKLGAEANYTVKMNWKAINPAS